MQITDAIISEISKHVEPDDLPGDLPEIAEFLGCYKALKIGARMGAGRIYLKCWSNDSNHWSNDIQLMVDIVGVDDAKIVVTNFNGAHVDIPKCDRFWKAWTYKVICTTKGMNDIELARLHNYSERHIRRIKKRQHINDDQMDLFG